MERIAWRLVIYLNLVRSVRRILDAIAPEPRAEEPTVDELLSSTLERTSVLDISADPPPPPPVDADAHRARLAPLLALEDVLVRALASPDDDVLAPAAPAPVPIGRGALPLSPASDWGAPSPSWGWSKHTEGTALSARSPTTPGGGAPHPFAFPPPPGLGARHGSAEQLAPPSPAGTVVSSHSAPAPTKSRTGEPVVSQRSKWRTAFSLGGRLRAQSPKDAHTNEIEGWWEDPEDPVHALHAAAGAIGRLWRDEAVRARLKERRVPLEESSGLCVRTCSGERGRALTANSAAS
jgi:hypothetical protein